MTTDPAPAPAPAGGLGLPLLEVPDRELPDLWGRSRVAHRARVAEGRP